MAQTSNTSTKKIAADILAQLKALSGITSGYDYPRLDLPSDMPCIVVYYDGDANDLNTVHTFETNYQYKAMLYKMALNQEAWYELQDLRDTIVDSIHSDRSLSGTALHMFVESSTPFVDNNSRVGIEFTLLVKRIEEYI